ncbi:MAG: hypothetical protein ACPL7D_00725 [Candidatus Sumerlaeaceae bacterium]|jgi:chromosome segregation ATPase
MLDRIEELERKIGALVAKIEEAKRRIAQLQAHNAELLQIAEEKKKTDEENVRLQDRIRELERELNSRDDKEAAARDRLQAVLNRLDVLENEIGQLQAGMQNE